MGVEIQAALKADKDAGGCLRWCDPEPDAEWEFDGYCAVAATAYFFLKGEELAGFDPVAGTVDWKTAGRTAYMAGFRSFCSWGGGHWWLEHRQDGGFSQVIDLNIGVNDPKTTSNTSSRGTARSSRDQVTSGRARGRSSSSAWSRKAARSVVAAADGSDATSASAHRRRIVAVASQQTGRDGRGKTQIQGMSDRLMRPSDGPG